MIEFWLDTKSESFHFHRRYVSLGRDRRCSFVLPDPSVMPVHAALVSEIEGLFLERKDFDALTFLNRAPIHERVPVYDGDAIDIGPWTLYVRSNQLERRDLPAGWELDFGMTPSDITIVRTVRMPQVAPRRTPDDSSSSFII